MYKSTSAAVLALAAGASAADFSAWAFGNMFTVGPATGNAYITKATWSVLPPAVPSDATMKDKSDPPFLSLWIGVSDSISDENTALVQPLLNWSPDQDSQGCPAAADEWCVDASTYFASGQVAQPYVQVPKNTKIDFEITATSAKKTTQKVWISDKLVSQQEDNAGWLPTYLYSSNECYQNTCGSVGGYTWSNISITLSAADKSFGNTLSLTGASGKLTTSDNGKTWTGSVKINADHFPAN
ncbi:uncharacterized protein LTHEOB_11808 [Lasiodiplodia theobromae]|uniref:uncharacterized protein n=1 Tax=Lasiodiplodia theobromae TaxID=45133 RepID=UPI0015C33218|nr:uncharacterized protein LTHEOB_11808 [Lasiodiplodia theobromae]KAF4536940.1 hypothetical protein LTHEOB_11808 [Lasiodiplodia theobromae]